MSTTTEQLQGMVAPGQQDVFDEFIEEVNQQDASIAAAEQGQASEGEDLLAGKFKSTEELEKAYLEAQRLISQRGQQQSEPQQSEPQQSEPELTPEQYTPELGKQLYGDTVASAIEAAEINPLEMAQKVYAGQDVSSYVDALVDKGGLPREVVETYLQGVTPAKAPAQQQSAGFTDADIAELKAVVGGDEQFQQLSQWAMANLDAQDLADYNAAVDSGNKAAARFALKQLKALSTTLGTREAGEPKLISGSAPPRGDVFNSDQQAVEARGKRGPNGRPLYETDPKYREWYDKTLARSNVFV